MKKEDIKVIEENKPTKEQAKKRLEQLAVFLSKNWITKKQG